MPSCNHADLLCTETCLAFKWGHAHACDCGAMIEVAGTEEDT